MRDNSSHSAGTQPKQQSQQQSQQQSEQGGGVRLDMSLSDSQQLQLQQSSGAERDDGESATPQCLMSPPKCDGSVSTVLHVLINSDVHVNRDLSLSEYQQLQANCYKKWHISKISESVTDNF